MFRYALLLGMVTLAMGCGSERKPPANLPTVHKVTGKVVDKSGQAVAGGTLQFASVTSPGQTGIAEIQPDGTFTMNTIVDGHKLAGAVAGPQTVTYMPIMTQDQAAALPVTLRAPVEVKPGDNDLTIKLE